MEEAILTPDGRFAVLLRGDTCAFGLEPVKESPRS
jgi:hypothetical protein